MKIDDFVQKKCNSGKNIQFGPKGFMRINLENAAEALEKAGAIMDIETKSLLIFRLGGTQVDLNSNGKAIIKTEDEEKAEEIFSKVFQAIKSLG